MNDRIKIRIGITIGALAGSVVSATVAANAMPGSPAASGGTTPPPPRVAVVSRTLDVFQTGAAVGPGVMNGIIDTAVDSQSLPAPGDRVQQAIVTAARQATSQMSTQGPSGIQALRQVVAPLACANGAIDAGLALAAGTLDTGATALSQLIQPFDVTAHETSTLIRSFAAPSAPC